MLQVPTRLLGVVGRPWSEYRGNVPGSSGRWDGMGIGELVESKGFPKVCEEFVYRLPFFTGTGYGRKRKVAGC